MSIHDLATATYLSATVSHPQPKFTHR